MCGSDPTLEQEAAGSRVISDLALHSLVRIGRRGQKEMSFREELHKGMPVCLGEHLHTI